MRLLDFASGTCISEHACPVWFITLLVSLSWNIFRADVSHMLETDNEAECIHDYGVSLPRITECGSNSLTGLPYFLPLD